MVPRHAPPFSQSLSRYLHAKWTAARHNMKQDSQVKTPRRNQRNVEHRGFVVPRPKLYKAQMQLKPMVFAMFKHTEGTSRAAHHALHQPSTRRESGQPEEYYIILRITELTSSCPKPQQQHTRELNHPIAMCQHSS